MRRVTDRHWVGGCWDETDRYEPENDWERDHYALLAIGLLIPNGCLDCQAEIYDILKRCAEEHGVGFP